jgi:branched-chain amino acid transport system ATP-binding protein
MYVLETRKLTKRFGGLEALKEVDLQVKEGAIHSIIGPNGAGKTTLFNCVTGFYQPEEGDILLKGRLVNGLSPDRVARRGVARTYQNIRLFKNMTTVENILVGMHCHLKSGLLNGIIRDPGTMREEREAVAEALRLLRFMGLEGMGDMLAKNLPYGSQRRLEIARALASKPFLLLLDEPTAGMNPSETQGHGEPHPPPARRTGYHHPAHRAPDARGDEYLRDDHRAGLRGENLRRAASRSPVRRQSDRGLPGERLRP